MMLTEEISGIHTKFQRSFKYMGVSKKKRCPQYGWWKWWKTHENWMIWGAHPYFWKHPNISVTTLPRHFHVRFLKSLWQRPWSSIDVFLVVHLCLPLGKSGQRAEQKGCDNDQLAYYVTHYSLMYGGCAILTFFAYISIVIIKRMYVSLSHICQSSSAWRKQKTKAIKT